MGNFDSDYAQSLKNSGGSNEHFKYCLKFAQANNAEAQFLIGNYYNERRNENRALEWYFKAAKQEYVEAQYMVGNYYNNGGFNWQKNENKINFGEAVKWFAKAAEQGYAKAQNKLGLCYEFGNGVSTDIRKAVKLFTTAAEKGNADAQNELGLCCFNGSGVQEDKKKAIEWFTKAAENGLADAQINLGSCYQHGDGVLVNQSQGFKWYLKAAMQGVDLAQYMVGYCYEYGIGVPADIKEAVEWYTKASMQGFPEAQNQLGDCCFDGKGVPEDKKKAVEWYKRSAEQGVADAQCNLGFCYYYGEGVPENKKTAVEWYKKAAKQGSAAAQFNLGLSYDTGIGIAADKAEAEKWYTKAAKQGSTAALFNLGVLYDNGEGAELDKAMAYYEQAAKKGNAEAKERFDALRTQLDNESRVEEEHYQLKPKQRECEKEKQLHKRLEEMERKVDRLLQGQINIGEKLNGIYAQILALNNSLVGEIRTVRNELCRELGNQINFLDKRIDSYNKAIEEKISDFIANENAMISSKLGGSDYMKEFVERARDTLSDHFGSTWGKLQENTRNSLVSAWALWASCRDLPGRENFDYSGVVICATSALEMELRSLLFDGFQRYMGKRERDCDKWPVRLTFKTEHGKRIQSDSKFFTMGVVPFLFGQTSKKDYDGENADIPYLNSCRNDYLKTLMLEIPNKNYPMVHEPSDYFTKNINKTMPVFGQDIRNNCVYESGSLIAQIEYIRLNHRNRSAHAASVSENDAEECCTMIMGKFEAENKINNVCSVLLQMYEIIK